MSVYYALNIEPLAKHHNRAGFSCGITELDTYLRKQAGQDIKRRIARVFVATLADNPDKIIGYYTLSTLSLSLTELPHEQAMKLPKHPIPAVLIGRLACTSHAQGKGVGKMLLMNAIKRTINVSDEIAIYAVVVDAINQQASEFYQHYGFSQLSVESQRLILPLKSFNSNRPK